MSKAVEKADDVYTSTREVATVAYRSSIAEAIDGSVEVEILLLDFKVPYAWEARTALEGFETFMIYRGSYTRVLAKRSLSEDEISRLMPALKETLVGETPGVGTVTCYFPSHGLRIVSEGRPVCEISVSLSCGSFIFTYPDLTSERRNLTAPAFAAVLKELMPVPESEELRFRRAVLGEEREATQRAKGGEPGATDNPDDAQRLREDY